MAKVMLDYSATIATALNDSASPPWLPRLTSTLADIGWDALRRDVGLTAGTYGTARVLAGDIEAPRKFVSYLRVCQGRDEDLEAIPIEVFSGEFSRPYEEGGVHFYTAEEIIRTEALKCLEDAVGVLMLAPTLLNTIAALVKSLHVIRPESDDHDVSFSEPHIPFSIFVSAPRESSSAGALRVAEAIVHEAMHLQLTLIERCIPLVEPVGGKYFSPWRDEYRTSQGVLHALYVFSVIDAWLNGLAKSDYCPDAAAVYARERRAELSNQFEVINSFGSCPELTAVGTLFVRQLIDGR